MSPADPLLICHQGYLPRNAAWLSIAAMTHNLLRAAGAVASLPSARARAATIRRDLITVAARTATNRRRPIAVDGHSDASHESSASP